MFGLARLPTGSAEKLIEVDQATPITTRMIATMRWGQRRYDVGKRGIGRVGVGRIIAASRKQVIQSSRANIDRHSTPVNFYSTDHGEEPASRFRLDIEVG